MRAVAVAVMERACHSLLTFPVTPPPPHTHSMLSHEVQHSGCAHCMHVSGVLQQRLQRCCLLLLLRL